MWMARLPDAGSLQRPGRGGRPCVSMAPVLIRQAVAGVKCTWVAGLRARCSLSCNLRAAVCVVFWTARCAEMSGFWTKQVTCRIGYLIQQVIPAVSRDPDAGVG